MKRENNIDTERLSQRAPIHWYPGHMAKAKREMQQVLKIADVAVEVVDARAPMSTRNLDLDKLLCQKPRVIILNKEDLADNNATKQWQQYFTEQGWIAVSFCAKRQGGRDKLMAAMQKAAQPLIDKWAQKGAKKMVRVMITGIPNVGKSSVINCLSGGQRAKTGATPGVTRGKQWVRLSGTMELLDTPGILWPKLSDEQGAKRLAFVNAIRDEVLEKDEIAMALVENLSYAAPKAIQTRFQVETAEKTPEEILEGIGRRRGFIVKGGEVDTEKAAVVLIDEFRSGKLGRITLERPAKA